MRLGDQEDNKERLENKEDGEVGSEDQGAEDRPRDQRRRTRGPGSQ